LKGNKNTSQNQKEKETEKWDISPSLSQNLSRASFCLSRESIYAFIYKPGSSICSGKQTIYCIGTDSDTRACEHIWDTFGIYY